MFYTSSATYSPKITKINYNATSCADLASSSNAFYRAGQSGDGIEVIVGANVESIPAYLFSSSSTSSAPKITTVTFEENSVCTSIGTYAFGYCSNLTTITIPESVTSIGSSAFYNCSSLTAINIPENVTTIADYVFYGCAKLSGVEIPENTTSIGTSAFYNCSSLTTITIPAGVTSIGTSAFNGCAGLTEVNYNATDCNASVTTGTFFIGAGSTSGMILNIGADVLNIPNYMFSGANVSVVNFAEGSECVAIKEGAFNGCTLLTAIEMPQTISNIGNYAFEGSGLQEVSLNEGLQAIGVGAFKNCKSLTELDMPASVKTLGDQSFYNEEQSGIKVRMQGCIEEGTKESVTQLLSSKVYNGAIVYVHYKDLSKYKASNYYLNTSCVAKLLTLSFNITLDYNISGVANETIEKNPEQTETTVLPSPTREGYTFDGWYLSEQLLDDEKVTSLDAIEEELTLYAGYTYTGDNWASMYVFSADGSTITGLVADMALGVVDFVIPNTDANGNNVVSIGDNALSGNNIHTLAFETGSTITSIGTGAFANNTKLYKVDFTNATSLTEIAQNAFNGCNITGALTLPNSLTTIGVGAFEGNKIESYTISNDTYASDGGIIYSADKKTAVLAPNILSSEIVLNASTETIENRAFAGSEGIVSISGEAVTTLNDESFAGSSVQYFDFPVLETIGNNAFDGADLRTVKLSTKVTQIGHKAFINNDNLIDIVIEGVIGSSRTNPPVITDTLASNEGDVIVYVANSDVSTYKSSDWGRFAIVGLEANVALWEVTVDLDGGTGYSTIYYIVEGKTMDLSVNPTKLGYAFVTWKEVVGDELIDFTDETPIVKNTTIKAIWEAIVYEIHYTINGGEIEGSSDTYLQEFTINDFGSDLSQEVAIKVPVREGYNFIGWYTNEDFDSAKVTSIKYNNLNINQIVGSENILLFAKWEIITFTMQFEDAESYSIALDTDSLNPVPWNYDFGFVVVLSEGYTQNTTENIIVNLYTTDGLTLVRTLSAISTRSTDLHYVIEEVDREYLIKVENLVINSYKVYFVSSLSGAEGIPETMTINHGQSIGELEGAPTKVGYNFRSWNQRLQGDNETIDANAFKFETPVYSDITLIAHFDAIEYTITLYLNGATVNGQLSESITIKYTIEDTIVLPLEGNANYNIQRSGYTISGWYSDFEVNEDGEYVINTDSIVNAVEKGSSGDKEFVLGLTTNIYYIDYRWNGGTYNDEYKTTFTVNDETFSLVVPEKVGHTFMGWYIDTTMTNIKMEEVSTGTTSNLTLYAKWEKKVYNITYHLNGSSYTPVQIQGQVVNYDKDTYLYEYTYDDINDYTLVTDVSRRGYTFGGWFDNAEFEGNQILYMTAGSILEHQNFYALWIPTEYTITFDYTDLYNPTDDIVSLTISTLDIEDNGGSIAITPQPSVVGYTFNGWFYNETKVTEITLDNVSNMTLVASFEVNKYTITLLGDNVENIVSLYSNDKQITTINYGQDLIFVVRILDDRYSQSIDKLVVSYSYEVDGEYTVVAKSQGVYTIDDVNGDIYIKIENIVLNTYVVQFITNGGTVVDAITGIEYGTTIDEPEAPTREGYEFGGWYTSNNLITEFDFNSQIVSNINLYAKWNTYTYTAVLSNNVNSDIKEIEFDVYNQSSISLAANNFEFNGYEFKGFYLVPEGSEDDYEFNDSDLIENLSSIYRNVSIIARFEPITYHIYYGIDNGRNHADNPFTYTINSETITLGEASKDNYRFVAWENADTGEIVTTIDKGSTGDIYLVATFELVSSDYVAIKYYANGEFYSEVAILKGTSITSLLSPKEIVGYNFTGYYLDEDFTEEFDVSMIINDTTHIYGKYEIITYTITYLSNVENFVNPNNKTNIDIEDDFNLEDATKLGYLFEGWYTNVVVDGENYDFSNAIRVTRVVNQNDDLVLYAKFTIIDYKITYILYDGVVQNPNPETYTVETSIPQFYSPSKIGYSFLYWTNSETGTRVTSIAKGTTGDLILEANYRLVENYIIITYFIDGNRYLSDSVEVGTTINEVVEPIKEHYVFEGWYSDTSFTDKISSSTIVTSDMSLYAKFVPIDYTISYVFKDESGNVLSEVNNTNDTVFNSEKLIQFVSPTKSGYTFDKFIYNDNEIKTTFGVYENIEVVGIFTLTNYKITYILNGGTADNPSSYTFKDNDIVLSDATREGIKFLGWYDSVTDTKVTTIDTSSMKDYTLIAKWENDIVVPPVDDNNSDNNNTALLIAASSVALIASAIGVISRIHIRKMKKSLNNGSKKTEEKTEVENKQVPEVERPKNDNKGVFMIPKDADYYSSKEAREMNKGKNNPKDRDSRR